MARLSPEETVTHYRYNQHGDLEKVYRRRAPGTDRSQRRTRPGNPRYDLAGGADSLQQTHPS